MPDAARSVADNVGDVRQRMAPVDAGHCAGQIAIDVHEMRARDMRRAIGALAGIDVGQVVPAIDDHARRIGEMRRARRRDQRRVRSRSASSCDHARSSTSDAPAARSEQTSRRADQTVSRPRVAAAASAFEALAVADRDHDHRRRIEIASRERGQIAARTVVELDRQTAVVVERQAVREQVAERTPRSLRWFRTSPAATGSASRARAATRRPAAALAPRCLSCASISLTAGAETSLRTAVRTTKGAGMRP